MDGRVLDFIALGILITVVIIILYGIIYIHDIPYNIAKKRNHPHLEAIHTAGWVSLFLMHALWPFLWIWATLYNHEEGWGGERDTNKQKVSVMDDTHNQEITALKARVAALEQMLESAVEQKPNTPAKEV
jgi:Protein of unknown function (DUF3302)